MTEEQLQQYDEMEELELIEEQSRLYGQLRQSEIDKKASVGAYKSLQRDLKKKLNYITDKLKADREAVGESRDEEAE